MLQTPRMMTAARRLPLLWFLTLNCLYVAVAHAALGGDAASVLADSDKLSGAVRTTALKECDIRDITSATGLHVREFLSRDGFVFAVTWSGPAPADLQMLLGTRFGDYAAAVARMTHPGLHRSVQVATSDLIVEVGGHLRAYRGRAYFPALIPAGMTADDLRPEPT